MFYYITKVSTELVANQRGVEKKMNRFSKTCVAILILSSAVFVLRPIVSLEPTVAASHRYQYLAVTTPNASTAQIQTALDQHAAEGWELATAGWSQTTSGISDFTLIFRKEAR